MSFEKAVKKRISSAVEEYGGGPRGLMRRARENAPVDCCLCSPLTEPSSTTLHPARVLVYWSQRR